MTRSLFYLIFVICFFTGCATYNVHNYSTLDFSDKSITVPSSSYGLKGALKDFFKKSNWKLLVDRGPITTKGSVGSNVKVESYDTFKTRYRLEVDSNRFDTCVFPFSPFLYYNISLVDNKTGMEVFALEGKGCQKVILKKFRRIIESR